MSMREDIERKPTAFEALSEYCAKYLTINDYAIVPETSSYCATIYFIDCGIGYLCFDRDGMCCDMGAIDDDDMYEHIEQAEREGKYERI